MPRYEIKIQIRIPIDLYIKLQNESGTLKMSMSELARLKLADCVILQKTKGD